MRAPLLPVILLAAACSAAPSALPPEPREPVGEGGGDPGIGFVALAWREDAPATDSLAVHAAPEAGSATVAWFVHERSPGSYRLEAAPGVRPNLVEHGYEEMGLPLDSVAAGWARVIHGAAPDGAPVTGWVRLEAGRTEHYLWRDFLPARGSVQGFRLEPLPLHRRPAGSPAPPPPADHELRVLGAEGEWLRVEVVSPSICSGAGTPAPRDTAWVRYLADDGRPLVWYPSRGC
jgi:hypothetical protein